MWGCELNISCYKCNKELEELGALLFTPPSTSMSISECKKIHICVKCYYGVMQFLQVHEISKEKQIIHRMGDLLELLVYPYLIEKNTVANIIAMYTGVPFKDIDLKEYKTLDVLALAREMKNI